MIAQGARGAWRWKNAAMRCSASRPSGRSSAKKCQTFLKAEAGYIAKLEKGKLKRTEAQTKARGLYGELSELSIEDVFDEGLHEFLTRIIGEAAAYIRSEAERLRV